MHTELAPDGAQAVCPICGGAAGAEERFAPSPLLRCASCGFAFLTGEADAELYADAYFEDYLGGDYLAHQRRRRHESRVRLDLLDRYVAPPAILLEVGAAAGFFLDEARKRGFGTLGVELNAAMAIHAREQLGLDVRTGRLEEVELEPASVDAVCAFHVVEHLADPLAAMTRIREWLRPDGYVFVEVPNADSAAARRRGGNWGPLDLPHHVGHFGPRALRTLLERAGLEPVRVDTVPFAAYGGTSRAMVALLGAAESLRAGLAPSWRAHRDHHQLLRGVARRSSA